MSRGKGAVVAIIDTGITQHADLVDNLLPGFDFIDDAWNANDGSGRDADASDPGDHHATNECGYGVPRSDSSWHGTHVAGTVAAVTNNVRGVSGTASRAMVVPLRALGKCGGGFGDIADAIAWAAGGHVPGVPDNAFPADAINLSLGGFGPCGDDMQAAIDIAIGLGSAVVVAAGNDGTDVSNSAPANCLGVIAVAAIEADGTRAGFSNYGAGIDLAAPGVDVYSTLNDGEEDLGMDSYGEYSGTSMAAPHVAAVVALVQSVSATPLPPIHLASVLREATRPFPAAPSKPIGAGILDARRALDAAMTGLRILGNDVAKPGLSASKGVDRWYTIHVPQSASLLRIVTAGGSGDADLYVRRGAAPTDALFDCKASTSTNAGACFFDAPGEGIYHVRLKAYATYSGLTLSASHRMQYANYANVGVHDLQSADSLVRIFGRIGKAPAAASISVKIRHGYRGDLKVGLVAPDGTVYPLFDHTGGPADDIVETVVRDLSAEAITGTWKLRVADTVPGDEGFIDSWRLSL